MLRHTLSICVLVVISFTCGCGSGTKTHPVRGRVEFKGGRPFTEGMVEFEPIGGGPNASGRLQPDGAFRLTTSTPEDGAVAGEHRAIVVWLPPVTVVSGERSVPRPIHSRFADYNRSKLRFTVGPG